MLKVLRITLATVMINPDHVEAIGPSRRAPSPNAIGNASAKKLLVRQKTHGHTHPYLPLPRPPGVRENGLKWKIDESHRKRGEALTSIFSSLDRLCFFRGWMPLSYQKAMGP
jgi:hypothetical protein